MSLMELQDRHQSTVSAFQTPSPMCCLESWQAVQRRPPQPLQWGEEVRSCSAWGELSTISCEITFWWIISLTGRLNSISVPSISAGTVVLAMQQFPWLFLYGMISARSSDTISWKVQYPSWVTGSKGTWQNGPALPVPSDCIFHQDGGNILQNNSCKWIVKEIVFLFISCRLLGARCYAKLLTCIALFYFAWQ